MKPEEKAEIAEELATDAKKARQIIANAEKNGYLPQITLNPQDKFMIEDHQASLEERIAYRTAIRNKEYLELHQLWGERYANPQHFSVGNWSKENYENYSLRVAASDNTLPLEEQQENKKRLAEKTKNMAYLKTSHIQTEFDWQLKTEDIIHTDSGKNTSYSPMMYNFEQQTLFVNDTILKNAANNAYKPLKEAALGNPAALNCIIHHELNHKQNWENDGLGKLSYTPVNAAKGAVLTEKISLCTEYLQMAKEYHDRKAKGDTTIKYKDGSEKPLDSLLDIYPGLKETAEKYGTDINKPEIKQEIVKTAINYWNNERGQDYTDQTISEAQWGNTYFNQCSFTNQLEALKNEEQTYKEVSTAMLSGVNIGGQQINLTDCKDLIDTFTTEDAKKMITKHNEENLAHDNLIFTPTYQEYQEINSHLEAIGKTTDAEKMDHIAKTIQQSSHSLEPYDKNLENIILKHNPKITADALNIEKTEDKIIAKFLNEKYDITEYDAKKQQTTEKISKMPISTLVAQQIQH